MLIPIFKIQLITSRKKMKELYEDMDSVHDWIDEAERDISEYKKDMSDEEKDKIKDKIEVRSVAGHIKLPK